jgi:hypothetical protein
MDAMSRTQEIIARFNGTRFVFQDTIIGEAWLHPSSKELAVAAGVADPDSPIGIKGEANVTELVERRTYRFLGTWANYFNKRARSYEKQFHFRTFVEHIPHDPAGLEQYLSQAGRGHGIGPAKSKKLVEHFGAEVVLLACRTQPNEVANIAGIPSWQAEAFADELKAKQLTENAQLECDKLLTGHGFPKTLTRKVIKEWGNLASEKITQDPYVLMQFKGVGFRLCDKLYMELGLDPKAIKRQALCLWYAIASDNNGHTWFPAREVIAKMVSMVGSGADFKEAIRFGRDLGKLGESSYGCLASIRTNGVDGCLVENGSTLWLAEGKVASQEDELAELVVEAMHESSVQRITRYEEEEITEEIPAKYIQCARCGRALTADEVYVLDGLPYGPVCIERMGV